MSLDMGSWNCIVCSNGDGPHGGLERKCKIHASLWARRPHVVLRSSQPPSDLSFFIYRMGLKAGRELLFSSSSKLLELLPG